MNFFSIFGKRFPIIGMVHLKPLPGSPGYNGRLNELIESAIIDAESLERGGVDGIMVENLGDYPYFKDPSFPELVASFTKIIDRIKDRVKVPVGVNVLRNGAKAALAIAYATGCNFIRVNVLTDAYVTDQGIIEGNAAELIRLKKQLMADNVAILADIRVKHAALLAERNTADLALDALERGGADALIVTGRRTGLPPTAEEIKEIKSVGPTIIGSGLNEKNLNELLPLADGAIVGTYFKEADIWSPVSYEKVSRFMKMVELLRAKYGHS